VDLTDAADELYGLRPDEFVARRNELAAEAKAAGDRDLSARIKKLAKPVAAAWTVNMLVRHEADQVDQVLGLGAALREAQESMAADQLRELGRQRRQLTAAVTRQARHLAADLGQPIGDPVADQVQDTLHAAMVDEDAAKAVQTGMLVRPLTVTGVEAADVVDAVAVPETLGEAAVRRRPAPAKKPAEAAPELTVVEDNSRRVAEAEAALTAAESELAEAERRLAKAEKKVEKREAKSLQLEAELDEAKRRVAELEERLEAHEDQVAKAEETRDEREEVVASARSEADKARKALDALR
jgi:hypothetical protein